MNASNAIGTGLGNYVIDYKTGTLTVTPATLTIAANDASSVYGQAPKTADFSASSLVNGDTISAVGLTTDATGAFGVGQYGIVASNASGVGLGNYSISYKTAL